MEQISNEEQFSKLAVASQRRCVECDQFKEIYLQTQYLSKIAGLIPEDKNFITALLNDLKSHIQEQHQERAKAFLRC